MNIFGLRLYVVGDATEAVAAAKDLLTYAEAELSNEHAATVEDIEAFNAEIARQRFRRDRLDKQVQKVGRSIKNILNM